MTLYYQPQTVQNGLIGTITLRYTISNGVDNTVAPFHALELNGAAVGASNPLPTQDANNLAFQGVAALTANAGAVTPLRSVGVVCTVAGNITFVFADTTTLTVPVAPGWQTFPFAVTGYSLPSSGAATVTTVVNLK